MFVSCSSVPTLIEIPYFKYKRILGLTPSSTTTTTAAAAPPPPPPTTSTTTTTTTTNDDDTHCGEWGPCTFRMRCLSRAAACRH